MSEKSPTPADSKQSQNQQSAEEHDLKKQQQQKQQEQQQQKQEDEQQQAEEEDSDLTAVEALSDEERAELKETFTLLDRDGDGFLTVKELGEAMRAMAQHPTEEEIQALAKKPEGEEGPALTDFDSFLTIMAKRMTVPEPDDQLLQAFRVFDKEGTGVISASDLRKIVTTLGECLTDEEVEELIREADDDGDGQINYQEFTQLLISN